MPKHVIRIHNAATKSTVTRGIDILYLLVVLVAVIIVMTVARAYSGYDHPFVNAMERHFQVYPGQTRVWPECGCTIRYVGTTVNGHRYSIVIDKLD